MLGLPAGGRRCSTDVCRCRRDCIDSPCRASGRRDRDALLASVLPAVKPPTTKPSNDLIALLVAKPKLMLVDKGYDSDDVRASLLLKGILPVTNRPQLPCLQGPQPPHCNPI